jgi:arylsulfatase
MSRASGVSTAAAVFLTVAVGCGTPEPRDAEIARPNIVVIMADDMGYSDVGAYGGEIDTPNIDELARGGVRFNRFYNTARCWTTRASLLTGRYPHQVGLGGGITAVDQPLGEPGPRQGYLDESTPTIAEVLGAAGYATYMAGKWHVGERPEHWPRQRGFDRYFGLISGASSYFEIIRSQPRIRQMALDDDAWEPPNDGFYMTDAITDYAVRFVDGHASERRGEPFFLYVAYTAPHWPLHALPEDIARYADRYQRGWDQIRAERHARMIESGIIDESYTLSPRPPSIPPFTEAENPDGWARRMQVYAAMVDRLDQGVGRIRESLRAANLYENTLILFLADNGGSAENIAGRDLNDPAVPIGGRGSYVAYRAPWANVSNTPFRRYKSWMYEGGISTPLIAHWPQGITEPGRTSTRVGHVIDLLATSLELAGAGDVPSLSLEGRSFAGVLAGRVGETHDALYWAHQGHRAMRRDDWKIVFAPVNDRWELYDLSVDPTELDDMAAANPDRLAAMIEAWEEWARRTGVQTISP